MKTSHILIGLVVMTLIALYMVSVQQREKFEEGADLPADMKPEEAARVDGMVFKAYMSVFGVPPTPSHTQHYAQIAKEASLDEAGLVKRIREDMDDGMPDDVVDGGAEGEEADEDESEGEEDQDTLHEGMTTSQTPADSKAEKAAQAAKATLAKKKAAAAKKRAAAKKPKKTNDALVDAGLEALRSKAEALTKMEAPVLSEAANASTQQIGAKLRSIAGQVSALASEYEVGAGKTADQPKGIESFISF